MAADEVVLLDLWASPFTMTVKIALEEKGVGYESREEDLSNKSSLLLHSNPAHKSVPVLIHNGKPVCESLIIVQYIDEVWKETSPLLPSDPYERAKARFWADFVNKKFYISGRKVWTTTGSDLEASKTELIQCYKLLEEELGEKNYFGGDTFGLVDVALVPFCSWFHTLETFGNFSMATECPKIVAWCSRCMERQSVSKVVPNQHKVHDFHLELRKKFGVEA